MCKSPQTSYLRLLSSYFFILFLLSSSPLLAQDWIYTTVKGDNLWNLSKTHLDSVLRYEKIRKLNNIEHPKRMLPGTKIRIPLKWIRSNPVSAEILEVRGTSLELQRSNGDLVKNPPAGTKINLGDKLKSGNETSIAIKFADNSIVTLHNNSLIQFDHLSAHGSTGMVDSRMHLLKGRLDTRVTPATGPGSRFEIQTPSAISAVRGTEYRASIVSADNTSNIEVLRGKVAVSGASNKKLIKAGFGTQVAQGKAPIAARKLLEPPTLKPVPERIRIINWLVSWEALKGAEKYRVEVANDSQFNTLFWQGFSNHTRIAFPDLSDGTYYIRIRGVDELELEGKSVVQSILLDAHPQAPLQLKPDENFVFREESPELQWTASAEAVKYRLEIASNAEFSNILLDRSDIQQARFDTSEFSAVGKYYWRLTSIDANGKYGPVGTHRAYEIKAIPEKVEPDMNMADDGKLVATWHTGTEGQTHQVQLAYDADFSELQFDETISEARISFAPVTGQVRFLRVRTIESDGYVGPWGTVQRVDPLPDKSIWLVPVFVILGLLLL